MFGHFCELVAHIISFFKGQLIIFLTGVDFACQLFDTVGDCYFLLGCLGSGRVADSGKNRLSQPEKD